MPKMSLMSICTVYMVIYSPQLRAKIMAQRQSQKEAFRCMTHHSVARIVHQKMFFVILGTISMHDTSLCCKGSPSKYESLGENFKRTGFEYKTQRAHRVQGYLRSPVLLFLTLCSRSGRGVWFSC